MVVRRTGRIHLLSTWDEGVPEEIRQDELFGLSWNPSIALDRLNQIDGTARAETLASDGWSPGSQTTIDAVFPNATLQDAGPMLRHVRGPKTAAELSCICTAAALAEAVLSAILVAVRPGVSSRELIGIYAEAGASLGSSSPPTEAVIWIARPEGGPVPAPRWPWRLPSARPLQAGELIAINPGAFYGGYEGVLGRTFAVGEAADVGALALRDRCQYALDATIGMCRPGSTGADLVAVWTEASGCAPLGVLARGVGLGVEPPVIGQNTGSAEVLEEGLVLAVSGSMRMPDGSPGAVGGVFCQDMVLVGAAGPTVLTRYGEGSGGPARSSV